MPRRQGCAELLRDQHQLDGALPAAELRIEGQAEQPSSAIPAQRDAASSGVSGYRAGAPGIRRPQSVAPRRAMQRGRR
jgi:hypothetical protein